MNWLGLDIGGANLKAADGCGWARSVPFALWREPCRLADAVAALIREAPPAKHLAVTMTGELCDCFRTKDEGVRQILAAVGRAAGGRHVHVYLVDGRFASIDEAAGQSVLAAASNWHALASFACRLTEDRVGLLVDIGSTTTDLIPLFERRPMTTAQTDTARLLNGELVYTGVGRTPVCAITNTLPWRGGQCPVAAEVFATTADVYLLLGELEDQAEAAWTADSRPLTREFAHERLARLVCSDGGDWSDEDARAAAQWVRHKQFDQLHSAVDRLIARMPRPPEIWVISGSGEFLASELALRSQAERVVSLRAELGPQVTAAAAAHAVAVLAQESTRTASF